MREGPWVDDPAIADEEHLWRRILLEPGWIAPDGRVSSMAFKDRRNPLGLVSVHRANLTSIAKIEATYPDVALAGITAGDARVNSHGVAPDAKPDDESHAVL